MNNQLKQDIADEISQLLKNSDAGNRDEFLRASLEKISSRLDKLESQMTPKPPAAQPVHVSQQRFKSLEDLADEIMAGINGEKDCPYEPTAKPCDNCSMCNSRGF